LFSAVKSMILANGTPTHLFGSERSGIPEA
jgi:hypothetical protein